MAGVGFAPIGPRGEYPGRGPKFQPRSALASLERHLVIEGFNSEKRVRRLLFHHREHEKHALGDLEHYGNPCFVWTVRVGLIRTLGFNRRGAEVAEDAERN